MMCKAAANASLRFSLHSSILLPQIGFLSDFLLFSHWSHFCCIYHHFHKLSSLSRHSSIELIDETYIFCSVDIVCANNFIWSHLCNRDDWFLPFVNDEGKLKKSDWLTDCVCIWDEREGWEEEDRFKWWLICSTSTDRWLFVYIGARDSGVGRLSCVRISVFSVNCMMRARVCRSSCFASDISWWTHIAMW